MSHKFTFTVTVELERTEGKFAPRDEMEDALLQAIEDADPGVVDGIGAEGDSSYEVTSWEVSS